MAKTISVKHKGFDDPVTINEEDFDPKVHERLDDEETEGKLAKPLSGKLPAEFPGFKELDEAGIHTYAQVRKARKDGDKIPGIGDGIGAQIDQVLAAGAPE